MSDEALSARFFPFALHPSNLVFPQMEMLHEGLERRGLRTDLTDLAGNPIHIVWGVLPMNWWVRDRARSRHEREIEWKASQCSGDLGNSAQLFAHPRWIRNVLEPYFRQYSPRRRATPAEVREIRKIRDRVLVYTLGLWPRLEVFLRHGEVEADTNLTENAIRPTPVGKKNWMFVEGEETGERSAVIYTIIESAKRHGHEPGAYIKDVLERMPGMKSGELDASRPSCRQCQDRSGVKNKQQ